MIRNYGVQVFITISLQVNRVLCLSAVIADSALALTYALKIFSFPLKHKRHDG